jgi:2-polyprenyl-3-methyl-5-hydroxy-6-metoxy-1,4-benzoquinol methylase
MFRSVADGAARVERTCPACASNAASPSFDKDGFTYVRCTGCGLVYISPIPQVEALEHEYDQLSTDYFLDERRLAIDEYTERHDREVRLLRRVGARGRLLDVGCATGSFMMAAKRIGFTEIHGIDVAAASVEVARRRGFDAVAGDFSGHMFGADCFDVVSMWNTLEHLPNPFTFATEAWRVLAPGGYLVVSMPNFDSLSVALLRRRYRYIALEHLNYFTPRTLTTLLTRAGFRVVHHETRSFNPYVVWQDWRGVPVDIEETIRETQLSKSFKTSGSFSVARGAYRAVDGLLRMLGRGDSLLAAAQKPADSQ